VCLVTALASVSAVPNAQAQDGKSSRRPGSRPRHAAVASLASTTVTCSSQTIRTMFLTRLRRILTAYRLVKYDTASGHRSKPARPFCCGVGFFPGSQLAFDGVIPGGRGYPMRAPICRQGAPRLFRALKSPQGWDRASMATVVRCAINFLVS